MSLGRRIGRLERDAGLDADVMQEACERIASEATKRVSDEDLRVMVGVIRRMRGSEAAEVEV